MRFFALAQDVALDTHRIHRTYRGVDNPRALTLERLYLDVGVEVQLLADRLRQYSLCPCRPGGMRPARPVKTKGHPHC